MDDKQLKQVLQDLEKCYTISPTAYESLLDNFDVYPHDDYQRMYYTIGYNGEYDELLEKLYGVKSVYSMTMREREELINEGGDVCWYITRLANSFGFKLSELLPEEDSFMFIDLNYVMKYVHNTKARLTESIKKFFRDGNAELTPEWSLRIKTDMRVLLHGLHGLGGHYNFSLSDMMRANVLKLGKRKLENKLHGDGDDR